MWLTTFLWLLRGGGRREGRGQQPCWIHYAREIIPEDLNIDHRITELSWKRPLKVTESNFAAMNRENVACSLFDIFVGSDCLILCCFFYFFLLCKYLAQQYYLYNVCRETIFEQELWLLSHSWNPCCMCLYMKSVIAHVWLYCLRVIWKLQGWMSFSLRLPIYLW